MCLCIILLLQMWTDQIMFDFVVIIIALRPIYILSFTRAMQQRHAPERRRTRDYEEPGTTGKYSIIGWAILSSSDGATSKSVFAANIHGTDLYHKEYDIAAVLECQDKTTLNAMQGTTCVRMKHSDPKTWTRHCEILMVDDINFSVSVTWHIDKTLDDVKFISGEPAQKKPRTMNWCAVDAS